MPSCELGRDIVGTSEEGVERERFWFRRSDQKHPSTRARVAKYVRIGNEFWGGQLPRGKRERGGGNKKRGPIQ